MTRVLIPCGPRSHGSESSARFVAAATCVQIELQFGAMSRVA